MLAHVSQEETFPERIERRDQRDAHRHQPGEEGAKMAPVEASGHLTGRPGPSIYIERSSGEHRRHDYWIEIPGEHDGFWA